MLALLHVRLWMACIMGYSRRVDANQIAVVEALRQIGASVTLLHRVGYGCPDLLVGLAGRNILLEVKVPKGAVRATQEEWFKNWRGQAHVARTPEEAIKIVLAHAK